MYRITETTDNKYLGHYFPLIKIAAGDEVVMPDGLIFEIQAVKETGDYLILSNPNYVITLKECD